MPRLSRETSPTGVYHVMLRGINRSPIFADEDDCHKFVKTNQRDGSFANQKPKTNQKNRPFGLYTLSFCSRKWKCIYLYIQRSPSYYVDEVFRNT